MKKYKRLAQQIADQIEIGVWQPGDNLPSLREQVVASAEHVGARFPEEARKIHYGETEERAIYGQASLEEARALIDEGIEVAALPPMPDDRN